MMNLQFHNNKVTYKNCLKFLGLVIEIQIKAMLRHDFPFEKKCSLLGSSQVGDIRFIQRSKAQVLRQFRCIDVDITKIS